MIRDEYGNELEEGDIISVGDYVQEIDTWLYEEGTYRIVDGKPFVNERELFLWDYIQIIKPTRERKIYGPRKGI